MKRMPDIDTDRTDKSQTEHRREICEGVPPVGKTKHRID
jgi:hypothetical protein